MNTEPNQSIQNAQAVKDALKARGSSLYAFAKEHGYAYRTVCVTVQRWAGRTDRKPHGGEARRIMADLSKLLNQENDHA
jgi:hypothetical protein